MLNEFFLRYSHFREAHAKRVLTPVGSLALNVKSLKFNTLACAPTRGQNLSNRDSKSTVGKGLASGNDYECFFIVEFFWGILALMAAITVNGFWVPAG